MSAFKWDALHSVGVDELDAQHRKFFEMVNGLQEAMSAGRGKAVMAELFDNLVEYTETHFRREEEMMRAADYPRLATHKAQHNMLTDKVRKLRREYSETQLTVTMETLKFLGSWLREHIMDTDKHYTPYLKDFKTS